MLGGLYFYTIINFFDMFKIDTPFDLSSDIGGKLCNPSNNQNLQNLGNLPSTLWLG
jgi:hypothetical protein